MSELQLAMGCGLYDRTMALKMGIVKPEGINLSFIPMYPQQLFFRVFRFGEFDVSEISLSSYIISRQSSDSLVAIPVFPVRRFRHSFIFVNAGSGIREPRDLIGKRVGVYNYEITAAVWIRGFLQHDYDVPPTGIRWVTSHEERLFFKRQPGLSIQLIPGANLDEMLLKGEIDALITPIVTPELLSSPSVKRLFEDYKKVELEYYARTKIYPIMHTIAIKNSVWQRYPWVAKSLLDAFRKAKRWWYDYMSDPQWQMNQLYFAWPMELLEERRIIGSDPYSYSLDANKKTLETLIINLQEQGLIERVPDITELFASNTIDDRE